MCIQGFVKQGFSKLFKMFSFVRESLLKYKIQLLGSSVFIIGSNIVVVWILIVIALLYYF